MPLCTRHFELTALNKTVSVHEEIVVWKGGEATTQVFKYYVMPAVLGEHECVRRAQKGHLSWGPLGWKKVHGRGHLSSIETCMINPRCNQARTETSNSSYRADNVRGIRGERSRTGQGGSEGWQERLARWPGSPEKSLIAGLRRCRPRKQQREALKGVPPSNLRLGEPARQQGEEGVPGAWVSWVGDAECPLRQEMEVDPGKLGPSGLLPLNFFSILFPATNQCDPGGLNLSALGIFSAGLSVLPPPAGVPESPPLPPTTLSL